MPVYIWKCDKCDIRGDFVASVDERDDSPSCTVCSGDTRRVIAFTGSVWAPTAGGMK